MRIACIGNMNNNMFSLARYLRDRGFDAHLLLLDKEQAHFHPSCDTFDASWQEFTVQLGWGRRQDFDRTDAEHIRASLAPYDFLIGCDTAPAHLHKAGRGLDVFVPFGSDVYEKPFLKGWRRIRSRRFARAQAAGIREASFVNGFAFVLPALERLGVREKCRYLGLPCVYDGIYHPDRIGAFYARSERYPDFERARKAFDVLVFHHSRLIWKTFIDPESWKGNDLLIHGFADLCRRRPDVRSGLVLFEYGKDVDATRELVGELGLEERVVWFPLLPRREIMVGLSLADLGTGEFGSPNFGGGTVYEGLALGKPVVHNRDDARARRAGLGELPPLANAASREEIADVLCRFCDDPEPFREMGRRALAWHERHMAGACIDFFVELIRAREQGVPVAELIADWPGRPADDGADEAPAGRRPYR